MLQKLTKRNKNVEMSLSSNIYDAIFRNLSGFPFLIGFIVRRSQAGKKFLNHQSALREFNRQNVRGLFLSSYFNEIHFFFKYFYLNGLKFMCIHEIYKGIEKIVDYFFYKYMRSDISVCFL